jgi:transposase-like protein
MAFLIPFKLIFPYRKETKMNIESIEIKCTGCLGEKCIKFKKYKIKGGKMRQLYKCEECGEVFSETKNTAVERLRTPLSTVISVINAISEGIGINAAVRVFGISKKSIYRWTERFSALKHTLFIYSLCNEYIKTVIEGDELYTKIKKNVPPEDSAGWTVILMDRASRFIWLMECGKKDRKMFKNAIETVCDVIEKTGDVTLLTDGERRYGSILFEICCELLKTGKRGRPRRILKKGVKVRIKNKGSRRRRGRRRPKFEAPFPEHPETVQDIQDADIHANHVEGFNAALRRICSAFRRKTNTYAKNGKRLQHRLDVIWILRNFVQNHCTTRKIPAVAIGVMQTAVPLENLMRLQFVACSI